MTENKKSLVFIRDENTESLHDLSMFRRCLKKDMSQFTPAYNNYAVSDESNDILSFLEQKEELRGVEKLLNSPFDILIVVGKRGGMGNK